MTAEQIAASLDEGERASVRYLTGDWRSFNKTSHFKFRREHGLATWRPSDRMGVIDFKLTPRGIAVKQALERDSGSGPKGENSRSEVEGEAPQSGGVSRIAQPKALKP